MRREIEASIRHTDLISTLLSLSTTRLPIRTLSTARQQLSVYISRFRTRLSTDHALHLTRLMGLLDALQRYAEEWRQGQEGSSPAQSGHLDGDRSADERGLPKNGVSGKTRVQGVEVMTPGELLRRLGRKSEGVNLLEVEAYLRSSRVRCEWFVCSIFAAERPLCTIDCTEDIWVCGQGAGEGRGRGCVAAAIMTRVCVAALMLGVR